jgi:hypothetical protein
MKRTFTTWLKQALSKYVPNSHHVRYLAALPLLETWRKAHSESYPVFSKRYELYTFVMDQVLKSEPIDYLEFGVYKGETIKYWAEKYKNPHSRFYGFDTFTGLPEKWEFFSRTMPEGQFSTGGATPKIEDARVSFIKGLFQDTLPSFLKEHPLTQRLVVHLDADIYSATLYALTKMHDHLKPGTVIMFDEFSSVLHEFRALDDYCSAYRRTYKILGATKSNREYYVRVAIEML